jgi:hypothetical protein
MEEEDDDTTTPSIQQIAGVVGTTFCCCHCQQWGHRRPLYFYRQLPTMSTPPTPSSNILPFAFNATIIIVASRGKI